MAMTSVTGEVTSQLLINVYVQLQISANTSAPSVLFCGRTGSMNGFIVDCSRYLSYFRVIDQAGNALQSNQSEKAFNMLKRLLTDLHYRFKKINRSVY